MTMDARLRAIEVDMLALINRHALNSCFLAADVGDCTVLQERGGCGRYYREKDPLLCDVPDDQALLDRMNADEPVEE
jgi:hypothetical protein